MSNVTLDVKTHCIEGQHKREYPQGLLSDTDVPRIQIKQYIPVYKQSYSSEGITIIAAGGNGFIKEAYEPFFEDLCGHLQQFGQQVTSIWIADVYTQGASALENSTVRGNDPSWWDHSRDLLHMVNVFRHEMKEPLVGLGHSMGAAQLYLPPESLETMLLTLSATDYDSAYLSTLHPRLLTTLILIEPQIHDGVDRRAIMPLYQAIGKRRETWPSRAAAEKAIRKSIFYANWDPRAVDRLVEYSLAPELPSGSDHPSRTPATQAIEGSHAQGVRTTTSRDMEVGMLARLNLDGLGQSPEKTIETSHDVPDLDPNANGTYPFYRPESNMIHKLLPILRPSVLWIASEKSVSSRPAVRERWLHATGTDVGGSGGFKNGRVALHVFEGDQHTLPLDDKIPDVIKVVQPWLEGEIGRWQERDAESKRIASKQSVAERQSLHPLLRTVINDYKGKEPLEEFVRKARGSSKL